MDCCVFIENSGVLMEVENGLSPNREAPLLNKYETFTNRLGLVYCSSASTSQYCAPYPYIQIGD